MAIFEVMTALSASFAIGIPTFMDKVMRPKYEERFKEFGDARRDAFIDEFEKALPTVKQAKQELTPEIIETVEELFNEWGQVKSHETTLSTLIKYRKFFFITWFIACAFALFSIRYSDLVAITEPALTLGDVTIGLFAVLFFATLWYGYELFTLDERLSKRISKHVVPTKVNTVNIAQRIQAYNNAEQQVADVLSKLGLKFERNVDFPMGPTRTIFDFILPSIADAKYIIEVKIGRVIEGGRLARNFSQLKSGFGLKTILVTNTSFLTEKDKLVLNNGFDYIIDFHELEKLKVIIK